MKTVTSISSKSCQKARIPKKYLTVPSRDQHPKTQDCVEVVWSDVIDSDPTPHQLSSDSTIIKMLLNPDWCTEVQYVSWQLSPAHLKPVRRAQRNTSIQNSLMKNNPNCSHWCSRGIPSLIVRRWWRRYVLVAFKAQLELIVIFTVAQWRPVM